MGFGGHRLFVQFAIVGKKSSGDFNQVFKTIMIFKSFTDDRGRWGLC